MKIEGFSEMLDTIQRERGIQKEALISAISAALLSACRRRFKTVENLEAEIDPSGEARIYAKKLVVSKVKDDSVEILLSQAKKIDPKAKKGGEIRVEVTPSDFGRFAAQTAKQVIIQRIREAEKEGAYEEFNKKIGEIVTGLVQRRERGGYLINLGRIETLLIGPEQIQNEIYRPKDRIKLYIVDVKKTPKGPMVIVSRTHPNLIRKLFELEVPELTSGILEIKGIAREPGRRSKVAVMSHDKNVGAVGTCVGHMGSRIQNIVKELQAERVDIIEWSENPATFIANSLSPAKIGKVEIDETQHKATVLVPLNQLSLAIGKEGQNVRLAAKLTGWKIDIVSEEEMKKEEEKAPVKEAEKEVKVEEGAKKIKISELAKKVGMQSKELISRLKELGIEVKSSRSTVTEEQEQMILEKFPPEAPRPTAGGDQPKAEKSG